MLYWSYTKKNTGAKTMNAIQTNYVKTKAAVEAIKSEIKTAIDLSSFERGRDYREAAAQWLESNNIDMSALESAFDKAQKALLAFGKSEAIKCGLSQSNANELFSITNYYMFDKLCAAALER
jgi:uncharacterized membrane protein